MRDRICDYSFYIEKYRSQNEVYKKFRFQFDNLFNTGDLAKNNEDFEKLYVADEEFEGKIDAFLKSINNTAQFCVGYTGIGKSTCIRHCLELGVGNAPVLTTKSKIDSNKQVVIFPTFLDGYLHSHGQKFNLPARVLTVCSAMEKKHPELLKCFNTINGMKDFYQYINKHLPHILEINENMWNQMNELEEEIIKKRLDSAIKNFPFEFCVYKLKYYMKKKYDTYDRLVILLDDIESLPEFFQEQIIMEYFHLFYCMQNTEYPINLNYRVNLLISLRPHTYRGLFKGMRGRMLESYSVENVIVKSHPVDLKNLFKKRFDYYTSMSSQIIGNIESWEVSYEKLMLINEGFDSRYEEMIINLCFMNVRLALAQYARVMSNCFWVQKNRERNFFSVLNNDITINNVTVIRALGCGNEKVFTGMYNSIIPNLFFTTSNEDYSIQCLLIIRYFRRKMQIFASEDIKYGLEAEELKIIYSEWGNVLNDEHMVQLKVALRHLFECKILRKSIMDFDDWQTLDTWKSISEESRLYLSPRGIELIKMLRKNSILLEMLRECAWRERDENTNEYSMKSSYDLITEGRQKELFLDLLKYIEELLQIEGNVFRVYKDFCSDKYKDLFGDALVVEELLLGVENSLRYSGYISDSLIVKELGQIKEKIREIKW